MEVPLGLQFSIALFTGMVAATFIPPVRKSIPKVVEVGLWMAFLGACFIGVTSVTDPNARNLSVTAVWALDQVVNTIAGLLFAGAAGWVSDNRFQIASWMVIVAGADVFALILIRSMRSAAPWEPRVRLGEWMELPLQSRAPVPQPVVADPLVDVNRRLAGASTVLGAAMLSRTLNFSTWIRNVMLPHELRRLMGAARSGGAGSRAGVESVRDATAHLGFAARAWYAAAGRPAGNGVAPKASGAGRSARRGLGPAAMRAAEVVDIQALVSAQSIGWYGPLGAVPAEPSRGDNDDTDSERPDTLAS